MEYSKTAADLLVDGSVTIEVGGASKSGRQLKGVTDGYIAADGIEYAIGNKIPLYLLGMMY